MIKVGNEWHDDIKNWIGECVINKEENILIDCIKEVIHLFFFFS